MENQTNTPENSEPEVRPNLQPKEGGAGPIIGSIVIIVLIVLGGIYYWNTLSEDRGANQDGAQTQEEMDAQTSTSTLSESDEITDIETDLNTTEIDGLDQELEDIENEIEAALSEI
jgi:uncharacterized protein HemX